MKKVKIMLMSVAVFAVVGGALAFNAKKFTIAYCQGTTTNKIETFLQASTTTTNTGVASTWARSTDATGGVIDNADECIGLTTNVSTRLKSEF